MTGDPAVHVGRSNGAAATLAAPRPDHAAEPRRRRSRPTPSQRVVVAGVVAAGFAMGVFSDGAPTGHGVVDTVYRGSFVALLALAGSRARRWAMVVASALAAIGSLGLGLLYGGVALLMSVVLVGRDLRNRVYGAVVGVLVGSSLLRLRVEWFLGASAAIAAVAAIVLLGSAFRVSRPVVRRRVGWVAVGVGAVMVVGIGMAVFQAVSFATPLEDAVRATTTGITAAQDGSTDRAAESFFDAERTFRDVADDAGRWWLFPARLVPVVGQNVRVVGAMSDTGAQLARSARRMALEVDYEGIRRDGGGVDLDQLSSIAPPVASASRALATAAGRVDEIRSPWVIGPLATRVGDFERRVDDLRRQTDLADTALRVGPGLFGRDGLRRYLVLLGNPAEARDLGGHVGNWAELTMEDGRIDLVDVGRPLEVAQPELENALAETEVMPLSFLGMRPATFPQNWGGAVDFPTVAVVAARLYGEAVGRPIDGVLYADPEALAAMLEITGPVPVPGLAGRELTSADAVRFLTFEQFTAYADPSTGDEALTQLVEDLFERLTVTTLPGPRQLGSSFGPLVREGRFRMATFHDADHELLGRLGLDNGFGATPGEDLLAVVSRNANPSKVDTFLRRSTRYEADWYPDSGTVLATVTVVLRNEVEPAGLPAYVVGNTAGEPVGSNVTDLAVMTPLELTHATVDGVEAPVRPLREQGVWRHSVRVVVPPGGEVRVRFTLEGDVDPGPRYRLRLAGQPLVEPGDVTLRIRARDGRIARGRGIDVRGGLAMATFPDTGQTVLTLRDDS